MSKFSILLFLSAFICLAENYQVTACTCSGRPQNVKGVEICSYYWYSDSIFIGLAEKVEIDNKTGVMKVTFSVEKPIRGVSEKTVEVFTSAGGGMCGYPFKQGEKYFVYGRKDSNGKLSESLCGPTVLLENAEDDLEYVKDIEDGKLGTRIYGSVFEDKQPTLRDKRVFENVSGIEITVKSEENEYKTRTNERGNYLFKEIPFGSYQITAKFPDGFRELFIRADLTTHYASLHENGIRCGGENFRITKQGSIRGKVIKFPSKEIKNSWSPDLPQPQVALIPLDENNKIIPNSYFEEKWAFRDRFEYFFDTVPAGNYLLAINPKNCPYPNNGVPTMFYPGVASQAEAKIITVKEGEQLLLKDFRSLPLLVERWFSGVVLNADRSPAANAVARLSDGDMNKCGNFYLEVKTDEFGRFKIKGFESYNYRIDARTEKKDGQRQFYAKPFTITQNGESKDIQLILDVSL